jgi:hypothetical protein
VVLRQEKAAVAAAVKTEEMTEDAEAALVKRRLKRPW